MKLEDQVASLEPSMKLKALGVRQGASAFGWYEWTTDDWRVGFRGAWSDDPFCDAFTVAELGEMLPDAIFSVRITSKHPNAPPHLTMPWVCDVADGDAQFQADTEADARAKMICHLIENKIITVQEINERIGV